MREGGQKSRVYIYTEVAPSGGTYDTLANGVRKDLHSSVGVFEQTRHSGSKPKCNPSPAPTAQLINQPHDGLPGQVRLGRNCHLG